MRVNTFPLDRLPFFRVIGPPRSTGHRRFSTWAIPLGVILICGSALAQTSADFLNLPVGSRPIALGETGAAFAEDAGALFWNPGALVFLPQASFAAGRTLLLDASHDHAAFSRNLGTIGSAALGMSVLTYDPLDTVNVEGSPTGTISPREWQAAAAYGRRFRGPSLLAGHGWGVSGKWVSSHLDGTAETAAFDAGILSRPTDHWRWGMGMANLGRGLKREGTTEALPRTFRAGTAWTPNRAWTTTVEARWTKDADPVLGAGVEYTLPAESPSVFIARGGYTSEEFKANPANGLRLGFGIGWKNLRVDYSFRFIQESAPSHGLSLALRLEAPGQSLSPALQALVDRGNRHLKLNQFPEAVLTFEEALRLDPACPPAWEGIEQARQRMGGR